MGMTHALGVDAKCSTAAQALISVNRDGLVYRIPEWLGQLLMKPKFGSITAWFGTNVWQLGIHTLNLSKHKVQLHDWSGWLQDSHVAHVKKQGVLTRIADNRVGGLPATIS